MVSNANNNCDDRNNKISVSPIPSFDKQNAQLIWIYIAICMVIVEITVCMFMLIGVYMLLIPNDHLCSYVIPYAAKL